MFGKKNNSNKENKYICECVQKPKTKLPGVHFKDDAASVAVLPYQWTPARGGTILSKHLKEKKEKHAKAVIHLDNSTDLINKNIETKIRVLAETLLCNVNNNQCDIDCVIKKLQAVEGSLSSEDCRKAIISIIITISARIQDIIEFREQALKLEKERADELKKVLRHNFHCLIAIGHISPKDLLKEFDDKMYEVNQQLLSNCSAYYELEIQLQAQADRSQRKARLMVNQLRFAVSITQRGDGALHCPSENLTERKRSKSAYGKVNPNKLLIDQRPTNAKSANVFMTTLTDEYQKAIAIMYTDFLEILKDFYNRADSYQTIHSKDSCKVVVESFDQKVHEIINHLMEITINHTADSQNYSENARYIKVAKRKLIFIRNAMNDTYSLLHEASHLWDAHMVRVALAQKLTQAAVEDLMSRHDSMELINEVAFNIALEQLAGANDAVDLNKCYDILVTLLQQRTDDYIKHNNAEIERLEEYENIRIPLTNTVKAELDLFLFKHPIPIYSLTDDEVRVTDTKLDVSRGRAKDAFAREMFQTELQASALSNWRIGFLEKIENVHRHTESIAEKIEQQIHFWVRERSSPLIKRHSLKMMSLEVSKQRVTAARDLRLPELLKREQSLQSHLGAIDHLTKNLPTEVSQYVSLDKPGLHPLQRWVNNIVEGMKEFDAPEVHDEVKMLKAKSYSMRLAKHRQLFEESLNPRLESCKKFFEKRIYKAMASNLRYISSLKLLHEGGSHSTFEAMEISSFLVKGNYALESCMRDCVSALNQLYEQIIIYADNIINPLQVSAKAMLSEKRKSIKSRDKRQQNKRK